MSATFVDHLYIPNYCSSATSIHRYSEELMCGIATGVEATEDRMDKQGAECAPCKPLVSHPMHWQRRTIQQGYVVLLWITHTSTSSGIEIKKHGKRPGWYMDVTQRVGPWEARQICVRCQVACILPTSLLPAWRYFCTTRLLNFWWRLATRDAARPIWQLGSR